MRSTYRTVLVTLVAALALSAAAASSALAAPEWYAKKGGALSKVTSPLEAAATTSLTVTDSGWLGGVKVKCTGKMTQTLEAGGVSKVTGYAATSCETVAGTCNPTIAEAQNLPWKAELYAEGTEVRSRLVSGGSGTPGWEFYCASVGQFDTCNFNTSANVLNTWSGSVQAVFDAQSNKTTCSQGGAEAGRLEGTVTLEPPKGVEAIQALQGGPAEWRQGGTVLSGAIGTTTKGTVKVTDTAGVSVECEGAGEGTAGAGAAGTATKWTASTCVTRAGTCASPSLLAVHMPWHSELLRVGSAGAQDALLNGGSGAPGYTIVCTGINIDTCTGTLLTEMRNISGGVEAAFDGEKLNCTLGGKGQGTLAGTQILAAAKGGKLEVS